MLWADVTPKDMPEWIQINSIDASAHDPGTAYVAATMYKSDDFRPYLYKTNDYGKTWKKIVNGLPAGSFTRVVFAKKGDTLHADFGSLGGIAVQFI